MYWRKTALWLLTVGNTCLCFTADLKLDFAKPVATNLIVFVQPPSAISLGKLNPKGSKKKKRSLGGECKIQHYEIFPFHQALSSPAAASRRLSLGSPRTAEKQTGAKIPALDSPPHPRGLTLTFRRGDDILFTCGESILVLRHL